MVSRCNQEYLAMLWKKNKCVAMSEGASHKLFRATFQAYRRYLILKRWIPLINR